MTHPGPLRQAAARLRAAAAVAPPGPYTLSPQVLGDGSRWLLGPDGDPVATVHDWAGGHGYGDDLGTPEATGHHLALWTPELARALADWIGSWQWQPPGEDAPEDYQHAARIARLVLGEEP